MNTNTMIENWNEMILAWYENTDIETAMTAEETNEELRKCFIEYKPGIENYDEVLAWYGEPEDTAMTLEEFNEELRKYFMIEENKPEKVLAKAA